jgi:hydroxymethylbilane synthase
VRGNIDTRLNKLALGQFDALILAVAGIERLGLVHVPYAPIPLSLCLPAPGQGALAVEIRADDAKTRRLVQALDDPDAASCVSAERAFLAALGAGCLAPAAALATVVGATLSLEAMVGSRDGRWQKRARLSGPRVEAEALGGDIARRLLDAGGEEILREVRDAEAGHEA